MRTERVQLRAGWRSPQSHITNCGRCGRGGAASETAHAVTLRSDDVPLAIDAEVARTRHEFAAVHGIPHAEETVAGNTEIGVQAGRGQRALGEMRFGMGNFHTGTDLLGGQIRGEAVGRGGAAQGIAEAIGETDGGRFVARRIHICDIVSDGLEAASEGGQ